jgi:hypothetical protein
MLMLFLIILLDGNQVSVLHMLISILLRNMLLESEDPLEQKVCVFEIAWNSKLLQL